jgi:AcrR family transcriptional regulator
MPSGSQQRRRYDSPLRAAQAERTRTAILAAATELFETRGWSGTGMRDVAKAAHVSIETVYAAFGSKAVLLKQALDVAVVGDAAPVPLADRDVFRRLFEGDPLERADAAAQVLIDVRLRTARLRRVLNQAVGADPQLSAVQQETHASERESIRQAAVAVGGRDVRGEDVDALFAMLSTEAFLLLTDTCRWSISKYRRWTVQIIRFVLDLDGAS